MQISEALVRGAERSSTCHFRNIINIFFRRRPLLPNLSKSLSAIMSTRDSAESARLDVAVKKMKQYRDITVRDAMKLADFSATDINDKNMQRKVLRRLPGKGKRAFNSNDTASSYTTATTHVASVIDAGSSNQTSDMSPLSDPSSSSSARKKTKHRLNSKQKQE